MDITLTAHPHGAAQASPAREATADRPVTRAVAGLALLGAGLVHFALAPQQGHALLGVLAALGAAELAGAVGILAGRLRVSTRAAVAATLPLVLCAALALGPAVLGVGTPLPALPLLAGALLGVIAALSLAASARLTPRTGAHPWRFTLALVIAAAVLPFIAVPAMSSAQYPTGDAPSMSQLHGHHH
ncbi:hypothetical protein SAMN04489806_2119 [Paramicrobacterium humi]|uniref:Uncharacterized protein n=1 Tax=Paramicrobacterium humi TaxID=640635 RepID=A0A1H4NA86_9MICO|nr:hypothetical protein [Microbacterium humi]SEB91678.1 hypothetical protein SAMN04489806_2119 [Microbacterium humi]